MTIDIAKTELNFQRLSNMPTGTVFASMLSTCVNKGISLEDLLTEQRYWKFRQNEKKLLALKKEVERYEIQWIEN